MKTPDEIKKGLECCIVGECNSKQRTCPYRKDNDCTTATIEDALSYIQQLEREWDAAVKDLRYSSECGTCGHYGLQGDNCQKCRNNAMHPYWKWRGVQEVE